MLIVDASAVLACLDRRQRRHEAAVASATDDGGPYLLSPLVLAQLDYLVLQRLGVPQELELLRQVAEGAWRIEPFDADDVGAAIRVVETYADQQIGVADASILVLAERHKTDRILTLDRPRFSGLRQRNGRPFTILPG